MHLHTDAQLELVGNEFMSMSWQWNVHECTYEIYEEMKD